jgi:hypothetical protein
MTTFLKNTNIAELLQVSGGNLAALEKMTEDFRQHVQRPPKAGEATSAPGDAGSAAISRQS